MCGGGKGVQQTSQQTSMPSWPAALAYNQAMGKVAEATSTPFQKYSSDPTAYVASLTPTQTGAIQNVTGTQGMTTPYYQAATGLTAAGAAPVSQLTSEDIQRYMSPFMSQVVDPVTAALKQQQGQQLAQQQAEAIKGSAFGQERSGIQRQTLRGQQQLGLGQALSPLYQTGYGQAVQTAQGQQGIQAQNLQRMLAAGQQFGGLGTAAQQAALQQASAQLQAGTLEQQTQTAQNQALYNEFQKQRMYPLQVAQLYAQTAGALGPLMGSTGMGYEQMPFFGGFAAEGGAIKGYDEGLGSARMGGAVEEAGDYARGGYAYGGDADLSGIVAQQRAAIMPQMEEISFPTGSFQVGKAPELGTLPERKEGILGSLSKAAIKDPGAAYEKAKGLYEGVGKAKDMFNFATGSVSPFPSSYAAGGDVESNAMSDLLNNPIKVSQAPQMQQPAQKEGSGILGGLVKAGASLASNYFLPGSGPAVSAGLGAMGMADGGRAAFQEGGSPENDIFKRGVLGAESAHRQFDKYGRTLTSPKGAEGISQIIPGTGPEAAKLADLPYDRQRLRTDKEYNTALGNAYFNKQLKDFGTEELAAAAYNAGPGRVRQALARAEREGGDVMSYLPAETRKYVPTVMQKAGLSQEAIGEQIAGLSPRDRSMMAEYPPRSTTEAPGSSSGLGSAQVREKGFMERTQEHPESLILPVLQGIGAMAGSKNRYALGALAEGLGAGAGSYLETGKALEEQRKMHEEADETRARGLLTGAEAMKTARDLPIWTDPMTGQRLIVTESGAVMDLQEYMQNPVPFMGAGPAASIAQGLGLRSAGASQAGYAPEGGVMPTGLSAVEQAGVEEAPGVATAKDLGKGPSTVEQPKILPTPKPIQYVGINLGDAATNAPAQEKSYVSSVGGRAALEESNRIRENINNNGRGARAQALYNAQAAQIIAEAVNSGGFETMGAGSDARARVMNTINTLARGAGLGDNYFGQNESRQQMLDKINTIRGESIVGSTGQKALGTLEAVLNSMPGTGQTPRAGTFNAASNLVQNQKNIDRQNYANVYGQKTSNLYNNVEDAFDSDNAQDKYDREEDAFQKIIRSPQGAKLLGSFMKGQRPDGSKASRADIDNFFKKNFQLDGMSRYFMGARGG